MLYSRGAVIDAQEKYTQYQLVLDSKTKTYYIKPIIIILYSKSL